MLVAAPTRSGKGVGTVIPNLLSWPGSAVVLDIKGENHRLTSGFRAAHGQRVFRIPPGDPEMRSHRGWHRGNREGCIGAWPQADGAAQRDRS